MRISRVADRRRRYGTNRKGVLLGGEGGFGRAQARWAPGAGFILLVPPLLATPLCVLCKVGELQAGGDYNGMETWRKRAEVACLLAVEDKYKEQRRGLLYDRTKREQKADLFERLALTLAHCSPRLYSRWLLLVTYVEANAATPDRLPATQSAAT